MLIVTWLKNIGFLINWKFNDLVGAYEQGIKLKCPISGTCPPIHISGSYTMHAFGLGGPQMYKKYLGEALL